MKNKIYFFLSIGLAACAVFYFFTINGCSGKDSSTVVVYVSEDQIFSEPVLKQFEKETGIKVRTVYDTEEAKGTGVMNRLIAEKNNPQADVYWANEPIRAEMLKHLEVSTPYVSPSAEGIPSLFKDPENYWTGFSARARVLIVNKDAGYTPQSVLDYIDAKWKGRVVIANPLFGTTTVQIASLMVLWGEDQTKEFMNSLKTNEVKVSTSNGESSDMVAVGEFDFSLVDSDDAISRLRAGKSVEMIFPDQERGEMGTLILPNAAVLIKGAPHPGNAKRLIDFLLSRKAEEMLAFADCAQIPLHSGVDTPSDVPRIESIRSMKVNYAKLAKELQKIQPYLKEWVGY